MGGWLLLKKIEELQIIFTDVLTLHSSILSFVEISPFHTPEDRSESSASLHKLTIVNRLQRSQTRAATAVLFATNPKIHI
jgi:hypothetical protein